MYAYNTLIPIHPIPRSPSLIPSPIPSSTDSNIFIENTAPSIGAPSASTHPNRRYRLITTTIDDNVSASSNIWIYSNHLATSTIPPTSTFAAPCPREAEKLLIYSEFFCPVFQSKTRRPRFAGHKYRCGINNIAYDINLPLVLLHKHQSMAARRALESRRTRCLTMTAENRMDLQKIARRGLESVR